MFSLHVDTARTWRGGQSQVRLTVHGLNRIGQRTALVAHPSGELRRRVDPAIELVPLAPFSELDLAAAWRFARVVARLAPDVIHAHDPHGVAMAALALRLGATRNAGGSTAAGVPALVAARRVDFHLKRNPLSRWKYRQVDCFITASDAIREMLAEDGVPAERTVTVHEGTDVERILAEPAVNVREAFGLPPGAPVIGNIAALVAHKGQRHLIDAAELVVREVPDARFLIFGEGELRVQLETQIRERRLESNVLLPGFRTDVLGCLKGFDLFVMSSVSEGLGTSLLDAMACSRPIVATRVGGIPEVVEDGLTGLLMPPEDPFALAQAILRVLRDADLRRRLGEAGFARVRERFGVERMVAETAAVYARFAASPRAA